jgi:hypothetical protein
MHMRPPRVWPNLPSSGRSKGRFASFGPPLMSNVRPLKHASHEPSIPHVFHPGSAVRLRSTS